MSSPPKTAYRVPERSTRALIAPRHPQLRAAAPGKIGLVLLDSALKPVYFNSEALRILSYPHQRAAASYAEISHTVSSILARKPAVEHLPVTTPFTSGRRRYVCRAFALEAESDNHSKPATAIVIEREIALRDLMARFHLTEREVEVVQHLATGLTSKEIAARMNLSLNTVKTFFRFVMIKMGVTTRAGIIGKLVGA